MSKDNTPFTVKQEPNSDTVSVVGPEAYHYVLRGANSIAHAAAWAHRLNAVYAMGFRAGQREAVDA